VTFELHDMLGDDNWAVVDWADAPEVHDKVIFQNVDTCFHVLLAGGATTLLGFTRSPSTSLIVPPP
jgi:hypothetical protein